MNQPASNPYSPPAVVDPPRGVRGGFEIPREARFAGTVRPRDIVRGYRRPGAQRRWTVMTALFALLAALMLGLFLFGRPASDSLPAVLVGAGFAAACGNAAYEASGRGRARRWLRDFPNWTGPMRGRFLPDRWELERDGFTATLSWDAVAGVRVTEMALLLGLDARGDRVLILPSRMFDDRDGQMVWDAFVGLERHRPLLIADVRGSDPRLVVGPPEAPGKATDDAVPFSGKITRGQWLRCSLGWRPCAQALFRTLLTLLIGVVLLTSAAFAPDQPLPSIGALLFVVLVVRFRASGVPDLIARLRHSRRPLARARGFVDRRGVTLSLPVGRLRFDWSALTGARVERSAIVLGTTADRRHAFALTRELFADEPSWQRAVSLVGQHFPG